jgi:hypothetical protein
MPPRHLRCDWEAQLHWKVSTRYSAWGQTTPCCVSFLLRNCLSFSQHAHMTDLSSIKSQLLLKYQRKLLACAHWLAPLNRNGRSVLSETHTTQTLWSQAHPQRRLRKPVVALADRYLEIIRSSCAKRNMRHLPTCICQCSRSIPLVLVSDASAYHCVSYVYDLRSSPRRV